MPDYSSDFFSDYNPPTDRSTFLTHLTILKSYNSYLANLKYWRKSLRSSIFTSSKKLKGTKGYSLRVFLAVRLFFEKNSPKGPPSIFLEFSDRTDVEKSQRAPFQFFRHCETFFQKKTFSPKVPRQFVLMICHRMDEKSQSVPSGTPIRFNFWVFPVP